MDNPFLKEDGHDVIEHQLGTQNNDNNITYNDVANKLLKDRFFLTALELHCELMESGKENVKLHDFFSNPGNFECQLHRPDTLPSIPRSSSQATLDSLDLTRYSEDGERGVDDRVAVLEFELRKAKETISALRANLTVATESETPTSETERATKWPSGEPIKPHEQRALNFLLNEYLLVHGYKLTSITFADENEDQDFEDWDDVGLNIAKPASLLQLYRDTLRQFCCHQLHIKPASLAVTDVACQTDDDAKTAATEEQQQFSDLMHQNEQLTKQVLLLMNEKTELAANIERLSRIDPVPTHFSVAADAISNHSATPEHFEMIEPSVANEEHDERMTNKSVAEGPTEIVTVVGGGEEGHDDSSSLNDDNDWMRVNASETGSSERLGAAGSEVDSLAGDHRLLPNGFQREVLSQCFVHTSRLVEAPLLNGLLSGSVGITQERLMHVLALSLPRIVPNIILNKREEVIPLLVCAIHLHKEPLERDGLLHWLFNLKKRPQEEERRFTLAGLVALARVSPLSIVENELLPHCWEQLNHRYVERRLLVAEACSALTPYVSSTLRNSLLMSILQQLILEDREEIVRTCAVRSFALVVAFMDDIDKYSQCEELVLAALQDSSISVVETCLQTLLPVLARWALDNGRLQSTLIAGMLQLLSKQLTGDRKGEPVSSVWMLAALRSLLPYVVMSSALVETVFSAIDPHLPLAETRSGFAELCHGLNNPTVFYEGEHSVGAVMGAFDSVVKQQLWPELAWLIDILIPSLFGNLELVDVAQEDLLFAFISFFKSLNAGFGSTVVKNRVMPLFLERLQRLELALANVSNEWPSFAIITVYLLAVIGPMKGEADQVGNTVCRFLFALSLSGGPMESLQTSVREMCKSTPLHETLMAALWEGVVHPRHVVRSATARLFAFAIPNVGESMTTNRIVPALITLASDPEISVRTATIPVFGLLIEHSTNKEVQYKTYFQLQSFLSDPSPRDNHTTLVQLVETLGRIAPVADTWFREDVIAPQLAAIAAYALQVKNTTRRADLAGTLVEAFSTTVYSQLSKATISNALLPGLRYLETLCGQSLAAHQETVAAMIREAESRGETTKPMERSNSGMSLASATSNVGQGVEDMKQRVSKIFQGPGLSRPTNLPNLQSLFNRKK